MIKPPMPVNEDRRVTELRELAILDTAPEQAYEDLARIATGICGMPIGLVSLIDSDRQWFKARQGLEAGETPRDIAFCAYAINDPSKLFVVHDARDDPRFSDNPLVTGHPRIRFYAGAPLVSSSGNALGTLCVIDHEPRSLTEFQSEALLGLSRQVSALLELRRTSHRLRRELLDRDWYETKLKQQQLELERENAELSEQSRTDVLTGLPNRRSLGIELAAALESAFADGSQLAFALVDVDYFKTVNDLHGHAEGDRTLVAIARQLQGHRGAGAFVARYGGEEFAIVLPRVSMVSARAQCESLREAVQNLVANIPVTVSIGVAVLDRRSDDIASLCARADRALYAAKRGGRNRVEVAALV